MTKNPLITIITATLNSAATIEVCLLSVANQSYLNIEHLIIDGLSSDKTIEIIKKFQNEHSHIRLISEKDQGVYDAMNTGIKIAKGDWIYFLGSDDKIYNNDVLKNVVSIIEQDKYEVIYGDVLSKAFNGRYDGEFDANKFYYQNICHQSIFFKSYLFKTLGLYNLKYKINADWDFNLKWFFTPKISRLYIDEIIAEYGDSGISTLNKDELFHKDKILNYLSYGNLHLPIRLRMSLFKKEIEKCCINGLDISFLLRTISRFPWIFFNIRINLWN
jgi:glycosyltransferase involved in cell wall biosynthesis